MLTVMSTVLTGDDALDDARAEVMQTDQRRAQPAPPGGAQAATAAEMQNQHVADEVSAAARRKYLGIPDDVKAKVTPFDSYVVVEMLTQVRRMNSMQELRAMSARLLWEAQDDARAWCCIQSCPMIARTSPNM